jgi:hypothetical protein
MIVTIVHEKQNPGPYTEARVARTPRPGLAWPVHRGHFAGQLARTPRPYSNIPLARTPRPYLDKPLGWRVGGVNLGEEESSVTALTIYGVTTAVVRYEADRSHSEGHIARVLRWARTFNSSPGVIGGLFGSEGPARPEVRLSQCKKSPAEARLEVR